MKLKPLSDYILELNEKRKNDLISVFDFAHLVVKYTKFLKQSLILGMFVPCDLDVNILDIPAGFEDYLGDEDSLLYAKDYEYIHEYAIAKEKVLFEGFEVAGKVETTYFLRHNSGSIIIYYGEEEILNIEGLLSPRYEIELTTSALEAIGLKE